MVRNTFNERATTEEKNYLLTFEALDLDTRLKENLERAYMAQDFAITPKLEKLTFHSQARLNRRYNELFKKKLIH
jgi:hypothetical protein